MFHLPAMCTKHAQNCYIRRQDFLWPQWGSPRSLIPLTGSVQLVPLRVIPLGATFGPFPVDLHVSRRTAFLPWSLRLEYRVGSCRCRHEHRERGRVEVETGHVYEHERGAGAGGDPPLAYARASTHNTIGVAWTTILEKHGHPSACPHPVPPGQFHSPRTAAMALGATNNGVLSSVMIHRVRRCTLMGQTVSLFQSSAAKNLEKGERGTLFHKSYATKCVEQKFGDMNNPKCFAEAAPRILRANFRALRSRRWRCKRRHNTCHSTQDCLS